MRWKKNNTAAELFEINTDLEKEIEELRELGLTEEDIEGYIEFNQEDWYKRIPKGELD